MSAREKQFMSTLYNKYYGNSKKATTTVKEALCTLKVLQREARQQKICRWYRMTKSQLVEALKREGK